MGSDWIELSLSDVYDIRSGLSKPRSEFGFGFDFLTFKDVMYNIFVPDKLSELVNSTKSEQANFSIKRGDVFLTRTSETMEDLGMSCVALKDYESATFNGFTKRLRPKIENQVSPEYAAYYFRSPKFRRDVTAMSSLSTRASLNNEMLSRLKIVLPSYDMQLAIGHILKTLDDKIELNRRMNETLEAMAQAIFKSWFVDFDPVIDNALQAGNPIPESLAERTERRKEALNISEAEGKTPGFPPHIAKLFPDSFEETDDGVIPKGWRFESIGNETEVVGGGTPSTKNTDYWNDGVHAFCTPKDMSNLISPVLLETDRRLTDKGVNKVSSGQLPVGTVLLSSRAPIGYLAISEIPVSVNQGIIAMKCNKNISNLYVLFWIKANMQKVLANANGSTFLEISKKNFRPILSLIPDSTVMDVFENYAEPIYRKIVNNLRNISSLSQIRDALLPKLLSGELPISSVEQFLEEIDQ